MKKKKKKTSKEWTKKNSEPELIIGLAFTSFLSALVQGQPLHSTCLHSKILNAGNHLTVFATFDLWYILCMIVDKICAQWRDDRAARSWTRKSALKLNG